VVDRTTSYQSPPPAAPANGVARKPRPARLNDGLSRTNNNNLPDLSIEIHVSEEPVATSCGCMTDLSHHQFHQHHHPPTPHYHANNDVTASSPTDELSEVTPANDLLSLGLSCLLRSPRSIKLRSEYDHKSTTGQHLPTWAKKLHQIIFLIALSNLDLQ